MARFPAENRRAPAWRTAGIALAIGGATVTLALPLVVALPVFSVITGLSSVTAGPAGHWRWPRVGGAAKTRNRLPLRSLNDVRNMVFFDPVTREPRAWYSITPNGELELFDANGWHPQLREMLKPVTPAVVQQLERRFKAAEQERMADEERRAATARADAEIARVGRMIRPEATAAAAPRDGGRADVRAPAGDNRDRTLMYDQLVSTARALIDAGRFSEARATAQRAIGVDKARMAARTLWAEAQTRLDGSEPGRYPRHVPY
jgi:hypothetical protein